MYDTMRCLLWRVIATSNFAKKHRFGFDMLNIIYIFFLRFLSCALCITFVEWNGLTGNQGSSLRQVPENTCLAAWWWIWSLRTLDCTQFSKIVMNFVVVKCHVSRLMFKITFFCINLDVLMKSGHWCMCCAQVVDEVRTGTYRQLFHPEQLISGKKTQQTILLADTTPSGRKLSTSCWTGFVSSQTTAQARNAFLKTVLLLYWQSNSKLWLEICAASNQILGPSLWHTRLSGLQGFCVYNACGGGTGSGLGCLMLERLSLGFAQWPIDPG